MKILQNSFNQYLNKNYFFEKKPNIAVAVSGGPDSMCLIHLLKNWINLNRGKLVVIESTVYPGCIEEQCVPIFEEFSNLKFNIDFFCGYRP